MAINIEGIGYFDSVRQRQRVVFGAALLRATNSVRSFLSRGRDISAEARKSQIEWDYTYEWYRNGPFGIN